MLWGNANGSFTPQSLNLESQLFPIQDFELLDLNNDGLKDIIAVGNWHMAEVETPRADAGIGSVLLNNGNREFRSVPSTTSGLIANKDVRNMVRMNLDNKNTLVIANNNDKLQFFTVN